MGKVHEQTNAMSADEVLRRLNLPLARNGKSYVCPACGNGESGDPRHGHGDGIKPRDVGGHVRWKCFKCGRNFSNFDLSAWSLGINPEHDEARAAEEVGELYGISDDRDFSSSKGDSPRRPPQIENRSVNIVDEKIISEPINLRERGWYDVEADNPGDDVSKASEDEKKSASTSEPKNYASGLYKWCREHYSLKKFVDDQGGKWRGLTFDTLLKSGCLYHPEFMLSEDNKAPCVIVPYDDYHYFARAVGGVEKRKGGADAGLYEPMKVKSEAYANFLFEGEINALSAAQVLKAYEEIFGCVATGSAANWHKVVPELERRFGDVEHKPALIVIFDDDGADNPVSRMHATELVETAQSAGYPAMKFFFEPHVDANDILQRGEGELAKRLLDFMEQAEPHFKSQRKEFAERRAALAASEERARQAELTRSDANIFSFAEYFAGGAFDRYTAQAERYANRKTGFENLDAELAFMPGLYVVGGLPATGKTTFCWQLVSNLAAAGEPVVFVSFEMSRNEMFAKTVTRELFSRHRDVSERLNLTNSNIRRGAGRNNPELNQLIQEFGQSDVKLDVIEPTNMDVRELIARELKPRVDKAGDKSLVVVLDYLQIAAAVLAGKDSVKASVDEIVLRLKNFQRDNNATLIVISSFNRQNYWQPVSFESFKESGGIEYGCDGLFGLQCDVDYRRASGGEDDEGGVRERIAKMSRQATRSVKLVCLKNRNGAPFDVGFTYHAAFDYFEPAKEKVAQGMRR